MLVFSLILFTVPSYADQISLLEGHPVWDANNLDLDIKQVGPLRNPIADISLFDDGSLLVAVQDKKSHAVLFHLDVEGKEVGVSTWQGRPLRKAMRASVIDNDRIVIGSGNGEMAFVKKAGEVEEISDFLGMGSSISDAVDGTFIAGGFDDDGTGKDRAVASLLKLNGNGKTLWHWRAARSKYMSWAIHVLAQHNGRAAAVISTNSNDPTADGRIDISPKPRKTLVCFDPQGRRAGEVELPGNLKVLDMADMDSKIALLAWDDKAQVAFLSSFDAKTCKKARTAIFHSALPGATIQEGRIIRVKKRTILSLSDSSQYAVETWGSAVTALLDIQENKVAILRGDKPRLNIKRARLYAAQDGSIVEYGWTNIWERAQSLSER